jgi:butyryl-CoA dehydrogenase
MALPFTYYSAGLESLSKGDAGFTLGVAIHGTVADGIAHYASTEIRKKHLSDIISGRKIAAFGLTEAESGSDAQAMKTSYRYDAGTREYILNGTKFWITNAISAEVFFVMARGDKGQISSFVVDREGTGVFERNRILDKMGVRGSNTAELVFQDYRVPASSLVGEDGQGFKYAMRMLNGGRVTIAAWSTGIAQGAYEKLMKYAHERKLFGHELRDLDNTKRELAEMAIEISASRELAYNAAFYKEHKNLMKFAAIAKVKATEVAVNVSERAIQLCGAYGYLEESKIERHLRDALLGRIGEGANELLKIVVIPRAIFKEFDDKPLTMSW